MGGGESVRNRRKMRRGSPGFFLLKIDVLFDIETVSIKILLGTTYTRYYDISTKGRPFQGGAEVHTKEKNKKREMG